MECLYAPYSVLYTIKLVGYNIYSDTTKEMRLCYHLRKSPEDAEITSSEHLGGCLEITEIGNEFSAMVHETDALNHRMQNERMIHSLLVRFGS